MSQFKAKTTNAVREWNANLRLKVNDVVEHLGSLYQNTSGKNSEPGVNLDDWAHIGISNNNLLVHRAGEETITGKKTFSGNIELKSILPELKLQETTNNRFVIIKTRDIGDGSLLVQNQAGDNLFLIKNPTGIAEPQVAIGNTPTIPTESQLYVFGGNNGANIDMRGRADRDECNMDFEGNDWDSAVPNSLGFSYFGSQYSLGGNVLGYPKVKLAHIRFNEVDHALITSKNQSGVVPIRFGINGTEIANLFDKGIEYKTDFSGLNSSNPRWLVDKEYVDNLSGWNDRTDTVTNQVLTANTDNLIQISTTLSGNGSNTLLDANSKITPTSLNDLISVDFAFQYASPSGTSNFLQVFLKVNGVVYRAYTHNMVKPTGTTDYVSVSFVLPVKSAFLANGGLLYVNPNTGITITNRYIAAGLIHKGV